MSIFCILTIVALALIVLSGVFGFREAGVSGWTIYAKSTILDLYSLVP